MICALSLNEMMNLFDPVKYFLGFFCWFFLGGGGGVLVPFFAVIDLYLWKIGEVSEKFQISNFQFLAVL